MGQKYSKHNGHHIKKFAVGDSVSVRVPRIDRANTDLQRLPCIVVEIVGKACSMYRLCCKEGVLNTCYSAGDLELFNASFEFAAEGWRTMPVVSLREAAKLHAPWNTFTKNKCTCKSGGCSHMFSLKEIYFLTCPTLYMHLIFAHLCDRSSSIH